MAHVLWLYRVGTHFDQEGSMCHQAYEVRVSLVQSFAVSREAQVEC